MARKTKAQPTNSRPNNKKLKSQHPYDDLSDRVCETEGCRRQIKTRLVFLRDAKICYACSRKNRKRRVAQ